MRSKRKRKWTPEDVHWLVWDAIASRLFKGGDALVWYWGLRGDILDIDTMKHLELDKLGYTDRFARDCVLCTMYGEYRFAVADVAHREEALKYGLRGGYICPHCPLVTCTGQPIEDAVNMKTFCGTSPYGFLADISPQSWEDATTRERAVEAAEYIRDILEERRG